MSGRIDGWKSIGAHFGRDRTTVMRWAERGMPVHRVPGGKRASVFAYRAELDEWLRHNPVEDGLSNDAAGEAAPARLSGLSRRKVGIAAIALLVLVAGAIGISQWPIATAPPLPIPKDAAVAQLYLQARDDWAKRTTADIDRAIVALNEVVRREPGFAPAHAALADAYLLAREFGTANDETAFPRALAAADRALGMDPALPAALRARGFVLYWWEQKPREAGAAFRRALTLAPRDAQTHFWYGNALADNGEFEAAFRQFNAARLLDPGSVAIQTDLAWAHWAAGQRDVALDMLARVESSHPDFAVVHDCIAYIRLAEGDYPGFVDAFERVARLRSNPSLSAEASALRQALKQGPSAVQAALMASALDEVATGRRRSHVMVAFLASIGRDRRALLAALDRAEARGERWGSAAFVSRIAGRWADDPDIAVRLQRLRQPPMQ